MQKVLTAAEMREVDRLTTEKYGIPSIILMENAAHAVVSAITEKLGDVSEKHFLIVCGKGNNGGDGAAIARILWTKGAFVSVELHDDLVETKGDAKENFNILESLPSRSKGHRGGVSFAHSHLNKFKNWSNTSGFELYHYDVLIDALFGTGLSRPLDETYSYIQDFRNLKSAYKMGKPLIVSVDMPSGLQSDLASTDGPNVDADTTITFTAPKPANVLPPASNFNGELFVANIGTPKELICEQPSQFFFAEKSDVVEWLEKTKFTSTSYKNKRGHALLIAGSENYSGAAVLCGNAAIRSGVGLVTIGTPRLSKDSIAGRVVPEVMVRPLAETAGGAVSHEAVAEVEEFLENVDAIAIGSGLSAKDESTEAFVRHFVEHRRVPTILDADALTLLSPFGERVGSPHVSKGSSSAGDTSAETGNPPDNAAPLILTPHQGEFLRLLGTDDKEAIKDRVAAVREFSQKHNVILVLKGERVLIGEPGGKVVVNPTGNSGLGKAGNGDTLTGIITGFAAQAAVMNVDMFETVVAAVYVAGLAGDIAEKKFGKRVMTASDVRECLVEAFEAVQ